MRIRRRLTGTRCCFCHDDLLPLATLFRCPGCRATFHEECRSELKRCSTIGCGGASPAPWFPRVAPDARALAGLRRGLAASTTFFGVIVAACAFGVFEMVTHAGTVIEGEDGNWTLFGGSGWIPSLFALGFLVLPALAAAAAIRRNLAIDVQAIFDHAGAPMLLTRREEMDSEGTTTILELREPETRRHLYDMSRLSFAPSLSRESEAAPLTVHRDPSGLAVVAGRRGDLTLARLTSRPHTLSAPSPQRSRSPQRPASPTRRARS